MPPGAGLLLLTLAACEVEQWRNADLQLEVQDAALDSSTLIRMCVAGVGSRDVALGAGATAYPGLPDAGPVVLTVDALVEGEDSGSPAVRLGRAGPVTFEDELRLEVAWEDCTEDCEPCRETSVLVEDAQTRLLAVRFHDPP